ncbi:MAG: hypothetical protein AAFP97_01090 [Pseudomonadota bacterium]
MRFLAFILPIVLAMACSPTDQTEVTEEAQPDVVETADIAAGALPKEDALAAQDALVEGFWSGDVDGASFLSGMAAFATHPDPEVVIGSTRELSFIYDEFPDLRRGLARHVTRTYGRVYRAARASDTEDAKQISAGLGNIMAREGNDQEVRNYLIRQGSLYLQLDPTREDLKPTVPLHLLESGFIETMRARPEVSMEPLVELLFTGTPLESEAAVQALVAAPNSEQVTRLKGIIRSNETSLLSPQIVRLNFAMLKNPATWDDIWYGFEEVTDINDHISDVNQRLETIKNRFSRVCSSDQYEEAVTFYRAFEKGNDEFQGNLTAVLDMIQDCVRFKETQGPSLTAALTQ